MSRPTTSRTPPRPARAAPHPAALVGLVLAGAGVGCLVVMAAPLLARPVLGATAPWRDLALPGLVLGALGTGLVTAGRLDLSSLRAELRRPGATWPLLAGAGTAVAVVAALRIVRGDLRAATATAWWAGLVAGAIVAAVAGWRTRSVAAGTPAAPPPAPGERSRRVVAIGVMVAVAAQLGVFAAGRDRYPLSPFRMYAEARGPDDVAMVGRFEGTTSTGQVVDLGRGVGVATQRTWVQRDDASRLEARARDLVRRHERRTGDDVTSYRVLRQAWRVADHPAPPGLERVDEVVVAEGDA